MSQDTRILHKKQMNPALKTVSLKLLLFTKLTSAAQMKDRTVLLLIAHYFLHQITYVLYFNQITH